MSPSSIRGNPSPDAEIVARLRRGDEGSLQELIDAHWAPLLSYVGRLVSGSSDPQDLVQTTFIRLWERRFGLKPTGSLRALLYTIARNATLDELRKSTRRTSREEGLPPPTPSPTPYEDVQGAELFRAAAAAVRRLPEKRREVFRLVREEGLSYQEAAQVLDLSPQTVANHMSLALADLRVALKPFLSAQLQPLEKEDPESRKRDPQR